MARRGSTRNKRFTNTLGPLVKVTRERLGMSQFELATEIGAQPTFISKIETGYTKSPAVHYLYPLARALGLPYATVYLAATGEELVEDPFRGVPQDVIAFATWLANLNEEQRRVAMSVAQAAVSSLYPVASHPTDLPPLHLGKEQS